MTLDFARSLPAATGTNVRGEQADTSWLYLLPTLELGAVVVIGSAPPGTLKALEALSSTLTLVQTGDSRDAPREAGLIYVAGGSVPRALRDPAIRGRLAATVESGGAVYLAPGGRRARRAAPALARSLGAKASILVGTGGGSPTSRAAGNPVVWAVPAQAEATVAMPRLVRRAAGFAARRARRMLRRKSADSTRVSEPDSSLGVERIGGIEGLDAAGRGLLVTSSAEGDPGAAPPYLLAAARAAGFPLSPHGWRLAPPRGYRSQKVIFFARSGDDGTVVIKLTQDPAFNDLLDNEADALEALGGVAPEDGPAIPELHFRARHADLSIVAQSALEGRPFVQGASPVEWDADAAAVAAAITTLGLRTAHPAGPDVGDALGEIADGFARVYDASAAERAALAAAADEIAGLGRDLPLVFMHGDATVFNVLIGGDHRVGLVDWENAERHGMPLWDLFHFLQVHSAWQAGAAGARYTPKSYMRQVGPGADVAHTEATSGYCTALGIPPAAVAPLRLLWLARHSVREARQLPAPQLGEGLYHRILRALLEQSD